MTYTYAVLEVSPACYDEIKEKLDAAGYQHAFHTERGEGVLIDMHGIALRRDETPSDPATLHRALDAVGQKMGSQSSAIQPPTEQLAGQDDAESPRS